jgi:hypothetical protein
MQGARPNVATRRLANGRHEYVEESAYLLRGGRARSTMFFLQAGIPASHELKSGVAV